MKTTLAAIILGLLLLDEMVLGEDTKATAKATTKPAVEQKTSPAAEAVEGGREGRRMEISDAQLENALKDKRYLQRQLKCTLGEAPCDPVGRRLKTLAPLVLRGSCPQCSPTEMRQIQKTLLYIQRNYPKEWAKMIRTYQ